MIETPTSPTSTTWSPRLRDPAVLALLALVLALELWTWGATEGYQLADSVEFMERARTFVRGEAMIDSSAIRPFGFSTVLVPFFVVADWLDLSDQRPVAWAIVFLQMAFGLGMVIVTMRVGGLLGGRRAGILAGILAGANPVLLQYSSQPVSGLAAGCFAGLAVEAAISRRDFAGGLRSGLWFAAAFLMAYQSLLIALLVLLIVLARDAIFRARPRSLASVRGMVLGLSVGLAAQALTDWAVYGRPGASLFNHFVQNAGFILASFFVRAGLRSIAEPIYRLAMELQGLDVVVSPDAPPRALMSPWFYVVGLPRMLVWPALLGLLLGLARGIARPSWKVWLLALTFLANLLVMSNKGSKDFRLWLPLLPILGALCAYGWTWIAPRSGRARAVLDTSFAAAVLVLGLVTLAPQGGRRFGTYWRAMDWVNGRAIERLRERTGTEGAGERRIRVASAYHWAVYLREKAEVDLVKLPWQLNLWNRYPPEKRADDLAALEEVDVFFAHLPILTGNPDLLRFVAERFEVAAAVHDQTIDLEGLGPILILERRTGSPDERVLFETQRGAAQRPRSTLWPPAHFVGTAADGEVERLVLVDWSYRALPPEGLGWITYRWTTPTGLSRDYLLLDRITAPDERGAWHNDHRPAWGLRRTQTWQPGEELTEGYLVVPAQDPYRPGGPYLPIGGSYRHGDLIPATLWMAAVDFDQEALMRGVAIERARLSPAFDDWPEEVRQSPDGLARVGRFFLPLPQAARLR